LWTVDEAHTRWACAYTMTITEVVVGCIGSPVSPAADLDVNTAMAPARPAPAPAGRGKAPTPADSLAWVTEEQTHLTPATYERLQAELEDLTTRGRVEIARAIESARALGDLSENGDYHAAKDTQGKMEARIRQLQATLKKAVVVEDTGSSGTVAAGTVVAIRFDGDDEVERFLVGSIEERHEEHDVVSPGSPLGKALLGHGAGEVVEYQTDAGATLRVEIVEVG